MTDREPAAERVAKRLGYRITGNSDEVGVTGWLCGTGEWIESPCTAAEFAFWNDAVTAEMENERLRAELERMANSHPFPILAALGEKGQR